MKTHFCFPSEVTFSFQGQVEYIWDPSNTVAATAIQLGSTIQASLRFDTATPDLAIYADDPTRGSFDGPGWLKINIGGLSFDQTNSVQVTILHGANGETQELFEAMAIHHSAPSPPVLPGFFQSYLAFWETGPPFDLLSAAELPTWMDFSKADENHAFINADTYQIVFSVSQVPEPTVFALFVSFIAVANVSRRLIRR